MIWMLMTNGHDAGSPQTNVVATGTITGIHDNDAIASANPEAGVTEVLNIRHVALPPTQNIIIIVSIVTQI
jgi:hypothetical protein